MDDVPLFYSIYITGVPYIFDDLGAESEEFSAVQEYVDQIRSLINDGVQLGLKKEEIKNDQPTSTRLLVGRVIGLLSIIKNYIKWMEHPIHINEFKDKYGHIYLQARSSIKDEKNKTQWVNAYVGSLKEYPKGIEDFEAIKKGKFLMRKKLKKYFNIP